MHVCYSALINAACWSCVSLWSPRHGHAFAESLGACFYDMLGRAYGKTEANLDLTRVLRKAQDILFAVCQRATINPVALPRDTPMEFTISSS